MVYVTKWYKSKSVPKTLFTRYSFCYIAAWWSCNTFLNINTNENLLCSPVIILIVREICQIMINW